MRSTWEVAYAKYLDKNNIKWQYEPKTFDLGDTTYTPDFYCPIENLYVEVKGFWWEKQKKKYDKFLKLYPEINISLLNKSKLIEFGVL